MSTNRAELDRAYDNSRAVADSARIVAVWQQRSLAVRQARPDHLDLGYGPRERNRIDYFATGTPGPVLVFIHGGYWQMRARQDFSFLAEGPLAHGIDVALIGYTLAPDASLDEIVAEVRSAVRWLASEVGGLGGDPARMLVSGWSAGAHLATMLLDEPVVAACLAISGIFELEPIRQCYLNDALALTEPMVAANSPIRFAERHDKPMIIAYGADELPELQRQSVDYAATRKAAGVPVELVALVDCHHFSVLEQLAAPGGALTRCVLDLAGERHAG